MKAIYLAAPFLGATPEETAKNIERVRRIARSIALRYYLPFAPHLALSYLEETMDERSHVLHHGLKWLERCDELWIVGEVTEGVADEIAFAKGKGIPVVYRVDEEGNLSFPRRKGVWDGNR